MITGDAVLAERQRRKMSRTQFAELTGLTPTKIGNIEKGRAIRPDELEKLTPHVPGDAASPGQAPAPPASPQGSGAAPVPPPPTPGTTAQEVFTLDEDELAEFEDDGLAQLGQPLPQAEVPWSELHFASFGSADHRSTCPVCHTEFTRTSMKTLVEWMTTHVVDCTGQPTPAPPENAEPTLEPGVPSQEAPGMDGQSDVVIDAQPTSAVTDVEGVSVFDDGVRRMTHGEFACFKRCRRKWYLAYYRQLGLPQEPRTGPAPLGTRIHKALKAWYVPAEESPRNPYEVLEETIAQDLEAMKDDPTAIEELIKEADLARAMLEGYFQWVQDTGADEGLRIVSSETRLEVDSGVENVHLLGKIDVRALREFDGARLVLDHKTVGDFPSNIKWLHMREQPLHYLLLEYLDLRASGQEEERSVGAIWNMLRKVKRTQQAKPPFYERAEVRHNVDTLRSYWQHVIAGLQAIEHVRGLLDQGWEHHAVAYPTPTRDCTWDCDFFQVCSVMDDGSRSEDMLAGVYVQVNPLKRYEPEGVAD